MYATSKQELPVNLWDNLCLPEEVDFIVISDWVAPDKSFIAHLLFTTLPICLPLYITCHIAEEVITFRHLPPTWDWLNINRVIDTSRCDEGWGEGGLDCKASSDWLAQDRSFIAPLLFACMLRLMRVTTWDTSQHQCSYSHSLLRHLWSQPTEQFCCELREWVLVFKPNANQPISIHLIASNQGMVTAHSQESHGGTVTSCGQRYMYPRKRWLYLRALSCRTARLMSIYILGKSAPPC